MKKLAILFAGAVLMHSCATTTVISSNIPESDVYIGGKKKGTTPYYHKDMLPMGSFRKVEIKKEGYESYEGKISKFDRANGAAIFAGFVVVAPWLWSGTYDHCYQFDLTEEGASAPTQSNFLEFSEDFTTSKGYHSIYVGEEDNKHVVMNDDNIHYLDDNMNLIETVDMDDDIPGEPIDAYIANGRKHLISFNYLEESLSLVTVDANNKMSTNKLQKIQFTDDIVEEDYCYGYSRNRAKNHFICYTTSDMTRYDEGGNSIGTYKSENGFIIEAELLDDDRVILLEVNNKGEFFVVEFNGEESKSFAVKNTEKHNWAFPRLSVNQKDNKVFVSTLLKEKDGKEETIKSARIYSAFLTDMELFSPKSVALTGHVRDKFLINRGVISDDKENVLCLEQQWKIVTTSTSSSTGSTRTSEKMATGQIVMVNFTDEEPKEKRLNKAIASSYHRPKLSGQFFIRNGEIYCVYNSQVNGRTFLTQSVFDTEMNYKTINYRDCYKEDKTLFHPIRSYLSDDNEILFLMQYKTKLGIAKSSF